MSLLNIKNVKKSFGSNLVLNDINLTLEQNDFYGLVGKNGSGKTTLINLIAGINKPDNGDILFYDNINITQFKHKIGLMPDSEGLYRNISGYDFLKYMGRLKKINLSNLQISQLLEKVFLEVPQHLKIKHYSFGMKKKLAIAQTLIGNPDLIILDEPTSGVDPESAIYLRQLFSDFHKEGKTILITSHNLSEIEKLCNKASLLDNGKLTISGELSTLLQNKEKSIKLLIQFKTTYPESELLKIMQKCSFEIHVNLSDSTLEIDCYSSDINNVLNFILQIKGMKIVDISTIKPDLEKLFFTDTM
ncbi:ABC transporter ATP-binding protein [Ruoffia sp. FAM 26254]|uniref:ABC transporter ATP-binding protein n=1 Tax=Ruoffia sp. FAM 26254 TaxID=3259518 RepID=UPI003883E80C